MSPSASFSLPIFSFSPLARFEEGKQRKETKRTTASLPVYSLFSRIYFYLWKLLPTFLRFQGLRSLFYFKLLQLNRTKGKEPSGLYTFCVTAVHQNTLDCLEGEAAPREADLTWQYTSRMAGSAPSLVTFSPWAEIPEFTGGSTVYVTLQKLQDIVTIVAVQ